VPRDDADLAAAFGAETGNIALKVLALAGFIWAAGLRRRF